MNSVNRVYTVNTVNGINRVNGVNSVNSVEAVYSSVLPPSLMVFFEHEDQEKIRYIF